MSHLPLPWPDHSAPLSQTPDTASAGWVSIETVATHFGMDPHTVRNWIKNGTHPKDPTRNRRLPAIRFGRRWRVRPADVRAFEAAMMAAEAGG